LPSGDLQATLQHLGANGFQGEALDMIIQTCVCSHTRKTKKSTIYLGWGRKKGTCMRFFLDFLGNFALFCALFGKNEEKFAVVVAFWGGFFEKGVLA